MPAFGLDPMTERARFLVEFEAEGANRSEVCARYGVSRRTGYKWLARFKAHGVSGLANRSHAPLHPAHKTAPDVVALIVAARKRRPKWGPRKLLVELREHHPHVVFPAASTVGAALHRAGLVTPRERPKRLRAPSGTRTTGACANALWCADFKGDFLLGDGTRCYPLTVTDAASRMLLACVALDGTKLEATRAAFERLFRRFGMPEAIRTDNGPPFATTNGFGVGGLSMLSVWWLRLGIRHERIEPGHPEQNGSHERMHRTLKAEAVFPPSVNLAAQQARLDRFRRYYNFERPHEALGQRRPAELYRPSKRRVSVPPPHFTYPKHMEVRRVSARGNITLHGDEIWVSEALYDQRIGLEQIDWSRWRVRVGSLLVAELDAKGRRLEPIDESFLRRAG